MILMTIEQHDFDYDYKTLIVEDFYPEVVQCWEGRDWDR